MSGNTDTNDEIFNDLMLEIMADGLLLSEDGLCSQALPSDTGTSSSISASTDGLSVNGDSIIAFLEGRLYQTRTLN